MTKLTFSFVSIHVIVQDSDCLASQAQLACILLRREGPDFLIRDGKHTLTESYLIKCKGNLIMSSVSPVILTISYSLSLHLTPEISVVLYNQLQVIRIQLCFWMCHDCLVCSSENERYIWIGLYMSLCFFTKTNLWFQRTWWMNWRESTEELAAESFGLIFSHTYANTDSAFICFICKLSLFQVHYHYSIQDQFNFNLN